MLDNIENYIFDLDGTLFDSSVEVLNCFEKAFIMANYNVDKSRFKIGLIGPPIRQIIKNIVPEEKDENKISEIYNNFEKIYFNDNNDISSMYEGVLPLLNKLKKDGKKIFIATFKPTIPTNRMLKMFGIEHFFEDVFTIDKIGKHMEKEDMIKEILDKYNLDNRETVMVGDSLNDIVAANKAGVISIAALWGYEKNKTELKNSALFYINSIKDLF